MIGAVAHFLLCLILFVWAPWRFSLELGETLPSIGMRGPLAIVELGVHFAVTALAVAAGWSLWNSRPHGAMLARVAVLGLALVAVQSLYWTVLPRQTSPGTELPLAIIASAHAGLWLLYLHRSARIREIAGT
jgi:hypothetical protein